MQKKKFTYMLLLLTIFCISSCGQNKNNDTNIFTPPTQTEETATQPKNPNESSIFPTDTEITPTVEPTAEPVHNCSVDGHEVEGAICKHCEAFVYGDNITQGYVYHGISYDIYENGACIRYINDPMAMIHDTIEYEGITYPIIKMYILGDGIFDEQPTENPQLSSLYIPPTVVAIGYEQDPRPLQGIKELVFPDTVRYIDSEFLLSAPNLEKLVFPENLRTISGNYSTITLLNCNYLTELYLPDCFKDIAITTCGRLASVSMTEACIRINLQNNINLDTIEYRPEQLDNEQDGWLISTLESTGTDFYITGHAFSGDWVFPAYVKNYSMFGDSHIHYSGIDFSRTINLETLNLYLSGLGIDVENVNYYNEERDPITKDALMARCPNAIIQLDELAIPDTVKHLTLTLAGGISIEKLIIPETVEEYELIFELTPYGSTTAGINTPVHVGYLQLPSYVTEIETLENLDTDGVIAVRSDCVDYFQLKFPDYTFVVAEY